jgi:hypothetical protein|tara:strand:+ start:6022 stop:6123 length:102 start_codon:yes stop_codon:yes gene_type:complete
VLFGGFMGDGKDDGALVRLMNIGAGSLEILSGN